MTQRRKPFYNLKFKPYSTLWTPWVLEDREHPELREDSGGGGGAV